MLGKLKYHRREILITDISLIKKKKKKSENNKQFGISK